jgi:hypothetical protein
MGLWKALEEQKVKMIQVHPRRENVEHILSIVLKFLNSASVRSSGLILVLVLEIKEREILLLTRWTKESPTCRKES